jgi:hypothetical protein
MRVSQWQKGFSKISVGAHGGVLAAGASAGVRRRPSEKIPSRRAAARGAPARRAARFKRGRSLGGPRGGERACARARNDACPLPCAAGSLDPTPARCVAPQASSKLGETHAFRRERAFGHVSRAARPELGPRASGSRQVPHADRRLAAMTTQVSPPAALRRRLPRPLGACASLPALSVPLR